MFPLFELTRGPISQSLKEVIDGVQQCDYRPLFPTAVNHAIRDLAIDCWARNSARRPSLVELSANLRKALTVRNGTE